MASFTLYGWAVCSWALIIAFQVFPSDLLLIHCSFRRVVDWLPYFSTQPDTGRPHMQNTVSTVHSYV